MERGEELPLIGRAEELAFLSTAIAERGGAVVAGAAGVGKTRLAREVSSVLVLDGWHVAWATATRSGSDLPLGGVTGLGLADDGMSFQGRLGLLSRMTAVLLERAGGRQTLVLVDDAHLLDELSAAFVHHLAISGAAAVLLTVRTGQQPPSAVVSLYKDGPVPRLELQPLGQAEFGELASAALGADIEPDTLHHLWSDAAGNVLFLRELVADAVDAGTLAQVGGLWRWKPDGTVGPRLAELVADRMGRLEEDRRLLAELLAVGEPLGADLVQGLVPGSTSPTRNGGECSWLRSPAAGPRSAWRTRCSARCCALGCRCCSAGGCSGCWPTRSRRLAASVAGTCCAWLPGGSSRAAPRTPGC